MQDYSSLAEQYQSQASPIPFLVSPAAFHSASACQTASTLIGQDPLLNDWVVCSVTCKRWSCPACALAKIKRLSFLVNRAAPNRLLTLTVHPALYQNPREAFEKTAPVVPDLIKSLRKDHGEVEYFRVTEVTAKGWPHYHLLLRSGYIPHAKIKKQWATATGARIVDVRKVHETFRAYNYLVKYLSKLHRIEWTERHVSYSRNFFDPEDMEKTEFPKLDNMRNQDVHPHKYLADHYPGESILEIRQGVFALPHAPEFATLDTPRSALGLSNHEQAWTANKPTQSSLPGMADALTPPYE